MKRERRGKPQHLPENLKKAIPTAKILYLYLKGRGEVDYSTYALAEALGTTSAQVNKAMLRLRELGLMDYEGTPRGNATYWVHKGRE